MLYQLSHVRIASGPAGRGATRNNSRVRRRSPNSRLTALSSRAAKINVRRDYPDRYALLDHAPPTTAAGGLGQRAVPTARTSRPSPATDHGLVVGDGVFEALKVTASGAFRRPAAPGPDDPLGGRAGSAGARHDQSSEKPSTPSGRPALTDGKIRITYTGGADRSARRPRTGRPTLVVAAEATAPAPSTTAIVTVPGAATSTVR